MRKVDCAVFMETKLYAADVERGLGAKSEFYWIGAAERLPRLGGNVPRRGLGMLVRKSKAPGVTMVADGVYLAWFKIPSQCKTERDMYLGVIHMPQADEVSDRDVAFAEIRAGLSSFRSKGMLWLVGDFNARFGMNGDDVVNTAGRVLAKFADLESLCILNSLDLCKGRFTRRQKVLRAGILTTDESTIDYVLVDSYLVNRVKRMVILDDEGIDSDHKPIIVDVAWSPGKVTVSLTKPPPPKRIIKYQSCDSKVAAAFENVVEPAMVEVYVGDHEDVDQKIEALTHALDTTAADHFGVKLVGVKSKGWFDKEVRYLWKVKLLAKDVLSRAIAVGDSALAELVRPLVKCATRRQKAVSVANRVRCADRMCVELENAQGDSKAFYSLWKKRVGAMICQPKITAVYDEDGKTVTDPVQRLKVWKTYCEKLCADVPVDTGDRADNGHTAGFNDRFAQKILKEMRTRSIVEGYIPEIDKPVEWEEVHSAIRGMANGKTPGPDGVAGDLIKLAGIGFEVTLTDIFNEIWRRGHWPLTWGVADLTPLHKKGDRLAPDNYRLIANSSALPKVFERVLDRRIREWAERVGALSDLQGGFRDGRSTLDQILILKEIAAERREQGLDTVFCFVDVAKAYDSVWRPGLFYKLEKMGLDPDILALIIAMYRRVVRRVIVDGLVSEEFVSFLGVPQGAVLSPLLYAFYVNSLHQFLREQGLGVWVTGIRVPLLLYADDIVLIGGSIEGMQLMLAALSQFSNNWRFCINNGKSEVVPMGSELFKEAVRLTFWEVNGERLNVVDCYKYLGIECEDKVNWNSYLRRIMAKARSAQALLLYQAGGSSGLRARTVVGQWKVQCRPILEYACELFEGGISATVAAELESVQSEFARAVLALLENPASEGVLAELGLLILKARRQMLQLGYWRKLCTVRVNRLLSRVFRHRMEHVRAGGGRRSLLWNFRTTLYALGLSRFWDSGGAGYSDSHWRNVVWNSVDRVHRRSWRDRALAKSSLSVYVSLGHTPEDGVAPYLDEARADRTATRLMSRVRLGTLWLMSRIHSVSGGAVSDVCLMCHRGREDLVHFVCECPVLVAARMDFLRVLEARLPLAGPAGRAMWRRVQRVFTVREQWASALQLVAGGWIPVAAATKKEWADLDECKSFPDPEERVEELVGQARWMLTCAAKHFLKRCWQVRLDRIGELRWAGHLLVTPPKAPGRSRAAVSVEASASFLASSSAKWKRYMDRPREPPRRKTSKNSNFFVVLDGSSPGVKYRWADVLRSIRGMSWRDARFKGYASLREAEEAWITRAGESDGAF